MVTILEADKESCSVEERICKVGVKQDSLAIVALHDLGHPVGELTHDRHRVVLRDCSFRLKRDCDH